MDTEPLRSLIEASLARAIEQTDSGVIVTNTEGTIEYANPAASRMTGYQISELLGQNPRLLKSGRQDPGFYADLWSTIRSGGIWRGELINCRKDGSHYHESMTISPVEGSDGAVLSYIAIKEDVSAIRAAQKAQSLLASIVESSSDAIIASTLEGTVTTWNRAAELLYGYSADEIIGRPVEVLVVPEEHPKLRENSFMVQSGEHLSHFEGIGLTKAGNRVDISLSLTLTTDERRRPIGQAAIIRDITAQKRAARALRESEEQYRRLFERNLAGVVRTTPNGSIMHCNPAFAKMMGFDDPEQLAGKRITDYYSDPRDRESLMHRIRSEGSITNVEVLFRRKDGEPVWVLLNLTLVRGLSEHDDVIEGTVFDISKRKRYEHDLIEAGEHAQAGDRAKSEFLANMSHVLRTPLNGIIGSLDLLSKSDLNRDQSEYVGIAMESAESLLGSIQQILDWTNLESQQVELERRQFYVASEVQTTLEALSAVANAKNLELKWTIDPNLPRVVVGDPVRFRYVIKNLAGNAIKFTNRGSVSVALTRMSQTDDHVEIGCTISDTGIGIPDHKQRTIFGVFTQADSSITRPYDGLGLGLPLSARIVKMMDGAILLQSRVGQGTEVRFNVRLALSAGAASMRSRKPNVPLTVPRNWAAFQRNLDEGRAALVKILREDDPEQTLTGQIWSASDGFIRAVTVTPLDTGEVVDLIFDDMHQIKGEIIFCQQWPNHFNTGIQLASNSRKRQEPRFPMALSGVLTVLGDDGPREAPIEIVDVSGSGLGVLTHETVGVGCSTAIKTAAGIILGEVRYCENASQGHFRCGIKMYQFIEQKAPPKPGGIRRWFNRGRRTPALPTSLHTQRIASVH